MDFKKKKIAVLMGGPSREHEISLRSGKNICASLQRQGYTAVEIICDGVDLHLEKSLRENKIDVVFIALHGRYGEDGQVQSLLERMQLPYTGSGAESSKITIDKVATKKVLIKNGLPTPEFQTVAVAKECAFSVPLVIKPILEGSSFGISIIKNQKNFQPALEKTLNEFDAVFVEKFIEGKEVTVGILEQKGRVIPLPILELVPQNDFYDFDAKYTPGKTAFILPAHLEEKVYTQVQTLAVKAHLALQCCGLSRVDFIVDKNNQPWITEINSIPGMTDQSDLPAEANAAGISFDELVIIILESADQVRKKF